MSTISASTTTTTAYKVTADTTGTLVLQTGSTPTTAATIDASQNMGLGVTPSAWTNTTGLQVQTAAVEGRSGLPSYATLSANGFTQGGAWKYISSDYASRYTQYQGVHSWYYAASGTAGNAISFTQAMTLDASGNLVLGDTGAPYSSKIARVDNSNSAVQSFFARNTNTGSSASCGYFLNSSGNSWAIEMGSSAKNSNALTFSVDVVGTPTERMRLDTSGNLLVGVTSPVNNERFNVTGGVTDVYQSRFRNTNTSPYGLNIQYTAAAPNGTINQFIGCGDTGADRFIVRSNGGIANYSANNVNLSDRREKTNFSPASSYLDKICAIPVQTFNYVDQNLEEDDGLTLGVVAQDVQAVAPELVMESNWAKSDEEPKMRLSIYQTDLQYALMKCIQEQQAIIETLTNRIQALENK